MLNRLKDELHNVISGKSQVRYGTIIQAITCYLNDGAQTGADDQDEKYLKKQETEKLEIYISDNNLWIDNIDFTQYVSEGAEQKVYLKDSEHVIKLNDAIYYTFWTHYFHNLLLHNYFFSDTAIRTDWLYKRKWSFICRR
jgi:pectate lyase